MAEAGEAFVALQHRQRDHDGHTLERLGQARAVYGRLAPEDLADLASPTRPVAELHGAASFYADLSGGRQGRRHVRVCEGTACFVASRGRSMAVAEGALAARCGTATACGARSIAMVRCLGYCYAAPSYLDGENARAGPGAFGPGAGRATPVAPPPVPYAAVAEPVVLAGLVGREPAWQVWPAALAALTPAEVAAEVRAAGLRGRGGAGFAVAAKWSAAAEGAAPRYVVGNGDEGDPGSYSDRLLMESDPDRVLEGLALAGYAVGAHRGFVLVRSEYPVARDRMRAAVARAHAAGHLGSRVHGTRVSFTVDIVEGAGSYVAGEETALLHAIEGMRGAVRPRPPYPTSRGLWHRPTAVHNVETLATLPWIVRRGGAAYARLGHGGETGTKLVCLNERFARPGAYEVALGTPLRHIVEDLGGGLRNGAVLRAVQVGGPLGGFLGPGDLDLPLLASALDTAGVALGHGSLVAVDGGVSSRALLRHVWQFAADESCGACTPCRVGTQRALDLLDRPGSAPAEWQRITGPLETASMCAFGRNIPRAVRSLSRLPGWEADT